jgi:protein required for attachment to host cells
MLGFLRKEYTQAINKLTIREVPKDLAHHNKPELEKALFI